jgi:hypothetical protein
VSADVTLAELAAEYHGLVVANLAATRDAGADRLDRRRASGLLVRVHAGVSRHIAVPEHLDQRLRAASMPREGVATCPTAPPPDAGG